MMKNVLLDEVTQQFGLFHLQQHNSTEAKRVHGRKSISFDSFQAGREGYNAACSSSRPAVNMTENTLKVSNFLADYLDFYLLSHSGYSFWLFI